jgi:hypothetical protein
VKHLAPEIIQAVASVTHSFNKPVYFLSFSDQGFQSAAKNGGNVHLNVPLVINAKEPYVELPSKESFDLFAAYQVTMLSNLGPGGTSVVTYLDDFARQFPNPNATVYKTPSIFSQLSDHIKNNYTSIFEKFNHHDPQAMRYFYGRKYLTDFLAKSLAESISKGIPVIPTFDAGSHFSFFGTMWSELHSIQKMSGIKPLDILKHVSLDAAKTIKLDQSVGSLQVGKLGDAIIVGKDPTSDLQNMRLVEYVVKNGVIFE